MLLKRIWNALPKLLIWKIWLAINAITFQGFNEPSRRRTFKSRGLWKENLTWKNLRIRGLFYCINQKEFGWGIYWTFKPLLLKRDLQILQITIKHTSYSSTLLQKEIQGWKVWGNNPQSRWKSRIFLWLGARDHNE